MGEDETLTLILEFLSAGYTVGAGKICILLAEEEEREEGEEENEE